jgi:diaminohydroxyphosphoribosylaminopyrimidine deaminase/5-amino-6-(5-phosphoribosylamino)uracil reductase
VLVVVSPEADATNLRKAGAEIVVADGIPSALADLGRRGITSLLLEGGRTLAAAFAASGEIDQARTFIAPILLGGSNPELKDASSAATGPGVERMVPLTSNTETVGEDTLLTARFKEW